MSASPSTATPPSPPTPSTPECGTASPPPYFTREQADELAAQLAAAADPQRDETIGYRAECPSELEGPAGDGYLHDSPQYDGDERWAWTGGQKVPGDPDGPTVYPIGAYGWIWTLVQ